MAIAIGRVGHEDQLGVVEHLEELRGRLIVTLVALAAAFGLCLWQNHALLQIINRPLARQTQAQLKAGQGPLGATYTVQQGALSAATELKLVVGALEAPDSGVSARARATLAAAAPQLRGAIARLHRAPTGDKPVTLGIGEPFTTTLGIALLFAFVLALPVILYELYCFLVPAISPQHQRVATSLSLSIPLLFVAGVAFGYFVVLPAALRFFANFNSGEFNVLVQASQYYRFAGMILLAMGLVFQVPVAILAATRAGVVTARELLRNRRYALLACGAVAALLPGDVITMLLETVPLYLLFELSALIALALERRSGVRVRQSAERARLIH